MTPETLAARAKRRRPDMFTHRFLAALDRHGFDLYEDGLRCRRTGAMSPWVLDGWTPDRRRTLARALRDLRPHVRREVYDRPAKGGIERDAAATRRA